MPATNAVIDWSQLRGLRELQTVGEPDVVGQVITMFCDDAPTRLARARAAAEREDCQALRFEAHSLRGTAGLIGASTLRDVSTAVEREAEANNLAAARGLLDVMARAVEDVIEALFHQPSS
jgi:HPt (histidine-containing phosphotransfer) domain-containing protein